MSRQVRRVPAGFDWPLNETWQGYLRPEFLQGKDCPDCEGGYSPEAEQFHREWYGQSYFDPQSTGSEPFLPEGEEAQLWARTQVERTPEFYGRGDEAILREAKRITGFWNGAWQHHLTDDDVAALIKAERLTTLTHDWNKEERRWVERPGAKTPTARQVNSWSLQGMGHDSVNASICIRARAEREGVDYLCKTCDGHARVEAFKGQRKVAKKWKPLQPPKGEWWQLWETVSEGSPVTPAFPTAMALANHIFHQPKLLGPGGHGFADVAAAKAWVENEGWAPSAMFVVAERDS